MMSRHAIVNGTLKWCNRQREKKGKKPLKKLPKGEKLNPESCPCGRATGLHVDMESAIDNHSGLYVDHVRIPLPKSVKLFVKMFDNGQFPEYVED